MTQDFLTDWRAAFGATPPLGYRLRADHPSRWTRFHALPGSTRSAETAAERQTILDRANALGAACFAPEAPVWLVRCPVVAAPGAAPLAFPDDGHIVPATVDLVRWHMARFDALFTAIAEERDRALFFSPEPMRVLAPYDGGFDLFASDPTWLARLEHDHRAWMSDREDRL